MKKTSLFSVTIIGLITLSAFTSESPSVKPIEIKNFNTAVSSGDNFYEYVNGNWLKNNPIPNTETRWGSFSIVDEIVKERLKAIVTELRVMQDLKEGSAEQKIRDYYMAAMDTMRIEKEKHSPLMEDLQRIQNVKVKSELPQLLVDLNSIGVYPFFYGYVGQDDKIATQMIFNFFQGGLGLPDKDYYLKDDAESKNIQTKYVALINQMFQLCGLKVQSASSKPEKSLQMVQPGQTPNFDETVGETVFEIEKSLAQHSKSRVALRDPEANYNKMNLEQLQENCKAIEWKSYFAGLKSAAGKDDLLIREVVVGQTEYMEALSSIIDKTSIESLRTYLIWNLINNKSGTLNNEIVKASFDFYEGTLRGAKEMKPRWKRMLDAVNGSMGELLGQVYVKRYFSPESKQRVQVMVNNLMLAYKERIMSRTWMADETKKAAMDKLEKITPKLAYPERWRDYSMLVINRQNSFYKNSNAVALYTLKYNLNKLNKPIDKTEWGMSPQTVNAYYNPGYNEIVFPAAIMQPPFFYPDGDDAVNYGAMGAVIGHEITHGFDDQGNQYDADGNLRNWWTDEDKKRFRSEADKLVQQYSNYVAIDTLKVNGDLTQGENIADLGGLTMAYAALQIALKQKPQKPIDGFTPEQRFFISFAQVWRNNIRDAELKRRLKVDVHSPGKFRTLGPLSNMPEFYQAFGIKPDHKMYRDEKYRVEIW